ncbi:MAG: DUF1801 domain-containing protein [Terriglobia bacterium]
MAPAKPRPALHNTDADTKKAVDDLMVALDHPFKGVIEAIRRSILGVDPKIAEGVKWNAPSYRTSEYFATTNLREKKGIGVILHLGAKVRKLPLEGVVIEDPKNLLKWLAKDRATIVFVSQPEFAAKKAAFEAIVRQWITYV